MAAARGGEWKGVAPVADRSARNEIPGEHRSRTAMASSSRNTVIVPFVGVAAYFFRGSINYPANFGSIRPSRANRSQSAQVLLIWSKACVSYFRVRPVTTLLTISLSNQILHGSTGLPRVPVLLFLGFSLIQLPA